MASVGSMLCGLIGPLPLKKLAMADPALGENILFWSLESLEFSSVFGAWFSLLSDDFILIPPLSPIEEASDFC